MSRLNNSLVPQDWEPQNSKFWDVAKFKWIFKAWVFAAMVWIWWNAVASDDWPKSVSFNAWCWENPTLCQDIISKKSANQATSNFNYDKKSNTLIIPAKIDKADLQPVSLSSLDNQDNSTISTISDNNVDVVSTVSTSDLAKQFDINWEEFNSIYRWETSFFDSNEDVQRLKSEYKELVEEWMKLTEESDIKDNDRKIFSKLKEIENTKAKLYVKYFENLNEKISKVLDDDSKKISFLSDLDTSDNEEIKNFHDYILSLLPQDTSDNVKGYSDSNYVSEDITSQLVKKESDVNLDKFSPKEVDDYSKEFTRLKDVNNIKVLSLWLNIDNVFEFLSDINNDWSVNKNDSWILYWAQLLQSLNDIEWQMILEWNGNQFYSNLSYVFASGWLNIQLKDKQDLLNLLSKDPLSKLKFIDWISFLNLNWADLSYILKYWKDWVSIWNESKNKAYNNELIWKIVSKMKDKALNLQTELTKIKASWIITDREYVSMLSELEKTVLKPWFEEQLFNQVVSMVSSLSATYLSESSSLNWAKFSYGKKLFAPQNEKLIKKFLDKLELDLWVVNTQAGNMIMLWIAYKVDNNLSDTEKLSYWIWSRVWIWSINNVLPVLTLGYTKVTNLDEINAAWIQNFDLSKNSFTLSWNYSMLNVKWMNLWLFAWYKWDRQWALENKFSEYSWLLDKLFDYNWLSLEQFIQLIEQKSNSDEFQKVNFVGNSLKDISNTLNLVWFNSLDLMTKKSYIQVIKMQLLSKFLWYYATKEEEKWYGISWFGLSLNILLRVATWWIPLLPWVEFSKMTYDYDVNQFKRTIWEILKNSWDWENINFSWDTTKFLSNLDKYINVKWVSVKYESWHLKISCETEENLFQCLDKNGVSIFVNPNKKISSQVLYTWNSIVLWDIKQLSTYVDNNRDSRVVSLVVWWEWVWNKIKLTQKSANVWTSNTPSTLSELKYTQRNVSVQNTPNISTKKVWIFM